MSRRTLGADDFNRADGEIDVGEPRWVPIESSNMPIIQGNESGNIYSFHRAAWYDAAVGEITNQWCQFTLSEAFDISPEKAVHLYARVNGTRRWTLSIYHNSMYISERPQDINRAAFSRVPVQGDVYRLECIDDQIYAYVNDTLVMQTTDSNLGDTSEGGNPQPLGGYCGYATQITATPHAPGKIDDWATGDYAVGFQLGDLNQGNTFESNGVFTFSGSLLDTVTEAKLTDGTDDYILTINTASDAQIDCAPVDVLSTKYPYGQLTLSVTDGDIVTTQDVTFMIEPGYEVVTLSGVDDTLMAENLGAVDGDLLEVEDTLGVSNIILYPDSDTFYDLAVPDGSMHTRKFYDVSAKTWDSGDVTVNQTGGPTPGNPPSFRADPAPPNGRIGEQYDYMIGGLIDGDRPITLADKGAPLPDGLAYDVSVEYEEKITGIPTTAEIMTGIITEVSNAV